MTREGQDVIALAPSTTYEKDFLRESFSKRDWSLQDSAIDKKVTLQWAKARDIEWGRVFDGTMCCNHQYLNTGLTRKADLARVLQRYAEKQPEALLARATPQSFVLDLEDSDSDSDSDGDGDGDADSGNNAKSPGVAPAEPEGGSIAPSRSFPLRVEEVVGQGEGSLGGEGQRGKSWPGGALRGLRGCLLGCCGDQVAGDQRSKCLGPSFTGFDQSTRACTVSGDTPVHFAGDWSACSAPL
ncbi:hypothetical protein CYMTET_22345 [Cymbomonas tetramitiformis]|uniref:Uncharacterized protein n=1 Tax=Cymbomonas tetramitiformis TaxID=36881 RepID=A0AAE0G1H2_9CHLO|nr:hypothetical protein CYMTET_22345 [Cymbomonas tetramitiformis]